MLNIKISEFCSLAKNVKWQDWLAKTASDLNDILLSTIKNLSGGCKKNTAMMVQIKNELVKRGYEKHLAEFLQAEFPTVLEKQTLKLRQIPPTKKSNNKTPGILNKHQVFESYNLDILQFPQKMIIIDNDSNSLLKRVKNFIVDKVKSDFIIIDDRAYIEYFLSRYKLESERFPEEKRELYKWRLKHNMSKGKHD